jgi:hypothetical protein
MTDVPVSCSLPADDDEVHLDPAFCIKRPRKGIWVGLKPSQVVPSIQWLLWTAFQPPSLFTHLTRLGKSRSKTKGVILDLCDIRCRVERDIPIHRCRPDDWALNGT